ncbi:phage portal protein [Cupriavidus necator]
MFLSIRADASESGDRSPWGNFWFEPVLSRVGGPVTSEAALQLTAVYACVRVLAEGVSTLPFALYREGAKGAKDRVNDHWLYRLFARRPNAFQNPMEFREMMQGHLALRGNAYASIIDNGRGEVTDLIPLHPDRVAVEMLSDDNWRYRVTFRDGTSRIYTRGEIFHLRGLSGDGVCGYSPILAARKALSAGIAAQDYGMRFFLNDARPPGWIEYPGQFKDDEQRRLFRERYQEQQTAGNRHKVAIFDLGMKFHEVKVSNDDAQFIETRKFSISEIARLFRVPPHMIGDLERATFSNIEQQSLEYVTNTLRPWLVRWEEAIRYAFLEEDSDLNVEFPVTALLRGDAQARSNYYHNGILDGWMTRNEARVMESLNPLDGLDEPLRPLNMVEEDEAENLPDQTGRQPAEPPASEPPDDKAPGRTDARLVALSTATAARVARKEISMLEALIGPNFYERAPAAYEKHAKFVAAALNVPVAAAEAYCCEQLAYMKEQRPVGVGEIEALTESRLERLALRGKL